MRNRIKNIVQITLLTFLGGGCAEQDESYGNNSLGNARVIELSCDINQIATTRVINNGFVKGDAIGVYIVENQDGETIDLTNSGCYANNVKFTYTGSTWEGESKLYWASDESKADAYSYYPYRKTIGDVKALSHIVQRRQDNPATENELSAYEASDFLWAKAENVQSGSVFNLNHKHLMSAIQLTLIEGEGFEENEWIDLDKAVSITNTHIGSSINLQTGVVTVDKISDVVPIIPYKNGTDWRCVVVPQSVESGKELIQISISGDCYSFTRSDITTYISGKMSKFAIKVNKKLPEGVYEFSLISESITAWESDEMSHNADTRSYITVKSPGYGGLEAAINALGLKYESIINLKIEGKLSDSDFSFIKENLKYLKAINLTDVELPDGIMPSSAFHKDDMKSSSLEFVSFPKSLKEIGDRAFMNTSISHELVFPEGLTDIGNQAFDELAYQASNWWNRESSNSGIYAVSFPSTIKHVGNRAFANASISHELMLPDELEYVGEGAFMNCAAIGNLHIPHKLKNISARAFSDFSKVTGTLEIPSTVETIDVGGFASSNFEGLVLNEGLRSIGEVAFAGVLFDNFGFYNGSNLTSYGDLDVSVYLLNSHPFGGELVVPQSVQFIGKRAFANTAFAHAYLPDNFEELPEGLFHYCTDLVDTIKVQSKVKHLAADVFNHCEKLTAIVLPEKLENISDRCFANCFNLDYIQCLSTTPPELVGGGHFDGIAKDNFTVVVPKGCVEAYRNAPGWSEFKRISEYKGFVCRPQMARLLNKTDTREVVLNADGAWTITHCPSWVHVSQTSGTQKTKLSVTIDALARNEGNRKDSIVFCLANETITTCYKIEQFDSKINEDEQMILQASTKGNGINLIFLGDGYDAKDIAEGWYEADMKQSMEYFFDIEPYKTYREYFNVYTAFAMSYESGIGTVNTLRDVKFKSIGGDANMRLKCNFDDALFYAIDHTNVQESDMSALTCVVVPNTNIYDGVCQLYPNGAAVALCPKSKSEYPYDARGIVQHEVGGHAFGKMADEYIYHYNWIQTCSCTDGCGHVSELQAMHDSGWGYNVWLSGKYKDVPWNHLINDNRYNDVVDIYDGGYFHKRGVYRSEYNSCMNNNVPYFSTWSRELIVKRIKELAGEQFSYEDFVAHDNREWGRDFTAMSRATNTSSFRDSAPKTGNAPIIAKHNPIRNK